MTLDIYPIGFVKNDISNRSEMETSGVKSIIGIKPEFASGLDFIEENTYVIICCFLHKAKRDVLQVCPKKGIVRSMLAQGVFATRSPDRPNPISISVAKLIKRKRNVLIVEKLDVINGTPVIDIKPYQYSSL